MADFSSEIALILVIDYTTWGNAILGTAPIGGKVWLFLLPFATGLIVLEELRKWLVRKRLFNPSGGSVANNK